MKRYIKSSGIITNNIINEWEDCIQKLYNKFLNNFADDVNYEIGSPVLAVSSSSGVRIDEPGEFGDVDIYANIGLKVIDDAVNFTSIFRIVGSNTIVEDIRKRSGLDVGVSYDKHPWIYMYVSLRDNSLQKISTDDIPNNSEINKIYKTVKDILVSNILDIKSFTPGGDIKSLYDAWFEEEIKPRLKNAFPKINFATVITAGGQYRVVFSNDLNPWYSGKDLYVTMVEFADYPRNIDYIKNTGYPEDPYSDCIPKFEKKFKKLGIKY